MSKLPAVVVHDAEAVVLLLSFSAMVPTVKAAAERDIKSTTASPARNPTVLPHVLAAVLMMCPLSGQVLARLHALVVRRAVRVEVVVAAGQRPLAVAPEPRPVLGDDAAVDGERTVHQRAGAVAHQRAVHQLGGGALLDLDAGALVVAQDH